MASGPPPARPPGDERPSAHQKMFTRLPAVRVRRFTPWLTCSLAVALAPAILTAQENPPAPQDPPEEEATPDPEERQAPESPAPAQNAAEQSPTEGETAEPVAPQGEAGETDTPHEKEVLPSLEEAQPFEWSWKTVGGLLSGAETYRTKNGLVSFRLGASIQLDGTTASESDMFSSYYGSLPSGIDLRRLRLSTHGRIRKMNFMASFDLGGDLGLKDLWFEGQEGGLALWGTPLGKFRFGMMREPFSFERQMASNFTAFMERSLPVQTFSPGRNLGAMVHDVSKGGRVHWAAGMYSLGSSNQDSGNTSLFSITGRCTGLPIYEDDGERLLHVGASFSSRNPTSSTSYFSRPEARFIQPLANTGNIDASGITLFGAELAGVYGPWWGQAEWIHSRLEAPQVGNPDFDGGYLQVGYILTGERRRYRQNGGVFDRYRPEEEGDRSKFVDIDHAGTLEVVGRVSQTDLSDGGIDGGKLRDLSAGLSWYPSWATRVELNYIYAQPQDRGTAHIVLLRLQYNPW